MSDAVELNQSKFDEIAGIIESLREQEAEDEVLTVDVYLQVLSEIEDVVEKENCEYV